MLYSIWLAVLFISVLLFEKIRGRPCEDLSFKMRHYQKISVLSHLLNERLHPTLRNASGLIRENSVWAQGKFPTRAWDSIHPYGNRNVSLSNIQASLCSVTIVLESCWGTLVAFPRTASVFDLHNLLHFCWSKFISLVSCYRRVDYRRGGFLPLGRQAQLPSLVLTAKGSDHHQTSHPVSCIGSPRQRGWGHVHLRCSWWSQPALSSVR